MKTPGRLGPERQAAAELWHAVMFAPTPKHLQAACQQLKNSPACIQLAVTHALLASCLEDNSHHPDDNPFVDK